MSGSHDQLPPAERMKAIDEALKVYFESENWLAVRRKIMPGAK